MVNSLSSLIMRYIFVCIKNCSSALGNYKLVVVLVDKMLVDEMLVDETAGHLLWHVLH